MKRAIIFVLVGVFLAGCSAAQPTATLSPSATPQQTATQTLPQPTATTKATTVLSPTATLIPSINHVYVFGDIFSDNGNTVLSWREDVAKGKLDANEEKKWETYTWEGRQSNGPVAVEVLAERLNAGLTDYAILGATSGYDNALIKTESGQPVKNGLLSQIGQFESELKGEKAKAYSLYFIFATAYDLWPSPEDFKGDLAQRSKAATDRADQAMINIADAITRLSELGARRFMVVNSADLSTTPVSVAVGAADYCIAFQSRIKSELPGKMEDLAKKLNVTIEVFDWLAVSDLIRSDPQKYGFTEINKECLGSNDAGAVVCGAPDEYFYWHTYSITHHVNEIMGEAMAEQLSK